jgi:predicted Zn-dependent peptidase
LNTKLREERGVTYGVRSLFDCRRGAGPFSIAAAVEASRLAVALDDIHQEVTALVGSRPPTQVELDDARRALIEGQVRQFETPSALVKRYGSLVAYGLPADHEAGFADRLAAIDLSSLMAGAYRQFHPDSFIAVVVADARAVFDELRNVPWARAELVDG